MTDTPAAPAVAVHFPEEHVAVVEMQRPPNNLLDVELVRSVADACAQLDDDPACRAIVLAAAGRHFCAGVNLESRAHGGSSVSTPTNPLYDQAVRLSGCGLPIVAAVNGAAIGGGLGLALVADFRIGTPESRFAANFARLGIHQGFGVTLTLPAVVGQQRALELLYTGRHVFGAEAHAMGLVDRLVEPEALREEAHALAPAIARSAPLAVRSIRQTFRGDLAERFRRVTDHEHAEQLRLGRTADAREGARALIERRPAKFTGT